MALQKCCIDIIRRLENPQIPFLNSILTFIGAVTLRNYLEQFSDKTPPSLAVEVHYTLLYICVALSLIILFYFATREPVERIARVVLAGFMVLPFVPVIDLILSFGRGYPITYLLPGVHHHLWQGFLLFGGPYEGHGVTPGQRIEGVLVIMMSLAYFYVKTNKFPRAAFFALLTYILFFFYAAVLFFLKMINDVLGIPAVFTQESMAAFYMLLLLPLSQVLFYLVNKEYFTAIWKDSRLLRTVHFILMVVLGYVFTLNHDITLPAFQLPWVFILPAIVFGGLFSIMVNNEEDQVIDRISNTDRPTVLRTIPLKEYRYMAWIFLGLSLIYAAAVNFLCFFTVLLGITNYYLYSSPPFRLKRIPFFSKLLIAFNSMLLFALGYSLPSGMMMVPAPIAFFFLVLLTAVINFIDIKDYEGDKQAGIRTLPTILGLEKSKFLIGVFFLVAYPCVYILVQDIRLVPALFIWGIWMFSLVNRKDYLEKQVFKNYILSLILLISYFLWIKATGQFLNSS